MVNDATIRLITEFEGFVPNWYADPAHGWKVPTCCYGHTDAAGEPKYADTKAKIFTKTEGMEILRRDMVQYENAVSRAVKVPLNANQHGALTSFTYNLGEGNLAKSTLVKKINAGDMEGASREFAKWNKAAGKVLPGLTRRREAERQLFLAPSAKPAVVEAPIPRSTQPRVNPDAPKPIPVEDADPVQTAPAKVNIWPWVLGALILVVLFFVTQVKF